MAERIVCASDVLLRPWQRAVSGAVLVVIAVLAGAGGVVIFMASFQGLAASLPPIHLVGALSFVVGGLALVCLGVVLDWTSTCALGFEGPTPTLMEIDANVPHIWTTHQDRRLQWPATHSLTQRKSAIFLLIGGAVFVLPNRVRDDPKATFAELQAWHGAAT
jgi:hypothetical protein